MCSPRTQGIIISTASVVLPNHILCGAHEWGPQALWVESTTLPVDITISPRTRSILWIRQNQTLKVQWSINSNWVEKENEPSASIHTYKDLKNNSFTSLKALEHLVLVQITYQISTSLHPHSKPYFHHKSHGVANVFSGIMSLLPSYIIGHV